MAEEKKTWKPKEIDWSPLKEFMLAKLASQDSRERQLGEVIRKSLEALNFLGHKEIDLKAHTKRLSATGMNYFFDVVVPFNNYLKEIKEKKREQSSKIESRFKRECIGMQFVIKERLLPELKTEWPNLAKKVMERKTRTRRPA